MTTDPLIARLSLRSSYPDNGMVDGVPAADDWWAAKTEVERLRRAITDAYAILCSGNPPYSPREANARNRLRDAIVTSGKSA